MGKTITSIDSLNRLFDLLDLDLLNQLLEPRWRIIAAVHFFSASKFEVNALMYQRDGASTE